MQAQDAESESKQNRARFEKHRIRCLFGMPVSLVLLSFVHPLGVVLDSQARPTKSTKSRASSRRRRWNPLSDRQPATSQPTTTQPTDEHTHSCRHTHTREQAPPIRAAHERTNPAPTSTPVARVRLPPTRHHHKGLNSVDPPSLSPHASCRFERAAGPAGGEVPRGAAGLAQG